MVTKDIEELTEQDFQQYERTRKRGRLNMWTPQAQQLSNLDPDTYFSVLHHYRALMEKFPDVRNGD